MLISKTLSLLLIVCLAHGLRNIKPEGPCEPGELVFVGFCNLCTCNPQGVPNQLCARSWCPVQSTPQTLKQQVFT